MNEKVIIVGGFIGLLPAGGVTWDYIQYPLGLSLMGHEVYYLEDTRMFPVYQAPGKAWDDASETIAQLQKVMDHFGFKDRWCYRDEASGKCFGLSESQLKKLCSKADVLINVSCSTVMREEYFKIPTRVLIDSDPMFTQIQLVTGVSFTSKKSTLAELVHAHTHHFTFGENINSPDCRIPDAGINWMPTRQPICLDYWPVLPPLQSDIPTFTTLMNWSAGKVLHYQGETWGQKEEEFTRIVELPQEVKKASFEIVINQTGGVSFPEAALLSKHWKILEPDAVAGDWKRYQQFIHQSFAEFSVAKNTYVKSRSGWFSCRSACYLAAGRPVVTQDAGWSAYFPSGEGLFAFSTLEEAKHAIISILEKPEKHAQAARSIAEEYFDSAQVLSQLLNKL